MQGLRRPRQWGGAGGRERLRDVALLSQQTPVGSAGSARVAQGQPHSRPAGTRAAPGGSCPAPGRGGTRFSQGVRTGHALPEGVRTHAGAGAPTRGLYADTAGARTDTCAQRGRAQKAQTHARSEKVYTQTGALTGGKHTHTGVGRSAHEERVGTEMQARTHRGCTRREKGRHTHQVYRATRTQALAAQTDPHTQQDVRTGRLARGACRHTAVHTGRHSLRICTRAHTFHTCVCTRAPPPFGRVPFKCKAGGAAPPPRPRFPPPPRVKNFGGAILGAVRPGGARRERTPGRAQHPTPPPPPAPPARAT